MKTISLNHLIGDRIMRTIKLVSIIIPLILYSATAFAKDPDCSGVEMWPTNMTFVHLKNAGFTDNDRLDFTKTRTIRLASEKIGKDLYRQIHHITFSEKSGGMIETISVSNVSSEECSMSDVDVFVVGKHLIK